MKLRTDAFLKGLQAWDTKTRQELNRAVGKTALHMLAQYRREITAQKAVDTGRFRSSTHAALPGDPHPDTKARLGAHQGAVADGVAYGARLEFGFHKADALGRHYNQPARPMLRTARDRTKAYFEGEVRRVLE